MKLLLHVALLLTPLFLFGQPVRYDTSRSENGKIYWTGEHHRNGVAEKSWDFWILYYENGQKRLEEITDTLFVSHKLVNAWFPDGTQILKNGNGFLFELGKDSTVFEVKDSLYQGYCRSYRKYYRSGWGMSPWKLYATGNFSNGIKTGEWIYKDSSGANTVSFNYEDGVARGKCAVYYEKTGIISETGSINDCKRIGLWKKYNEQGILSAEYNYENGEKMGACILYHPNGKIKAKGQYDQVSKKLRVARENPKSPGTFKFYGKERFHFVPVKTGTWFFYNENGDLINSKKYRNEMENPENLERINLNHKHYYDLKGMLFPGIPDCNYY